MIWWILGRSPDGFLASGVRAASEKSQVEASEVTLPSPSSVSGQDDKSKLHHRRQQCGGPRSPARPSAPHENDGLATEVKYSSCGRVRGSVRTPRHPGRARALRPASEGKGGARTCPGPAPGRARRCRADPAPRRALPRRTRTRARSPGHRGRPRSWPTEMTAPRLPCLLELEPPRAPQGRHPGVLCMHTLPPAPLLPHFLKEIMTSNFPSWGRKWTSRFKKPEESKQVEWKEV